MTKDIKKYLIFAIILFLINFIPIIASINKVDAKKEQSTAFSDSLVAQNPIIHPVQVWVTGYSSAPWQTDETPFITASGSYVRNGIAAANFLPFGTKFRLPEFFGDQIFVVEDRMHERYKKYVDIWFSTEKEAKNFGKRRSLIEIL